MRLKRRLARTTRYLRTLVRMSPTERRVLLRAFGLAALLSGAAKMLPYTWFRALVEGVEPCRRSDRPRPEIEVEAIIRAVDRAVRKVPGASCLIRAICLGVLLRKAGHPVSLQIGVRLTGKPPRLSAHAWVETEGDFCWKIGDRPYTVIRESRTSLL